MQSCWRERRRARDVLYFLHFCAVRKFARFGRLVVERVTVLTGALRQLNADVTRTSSSPKVKGRLSDAVNQHLDAADKLFAQVLFVIC